MEGAPVQLIPRPETCSPPDRTGPMRPPMPDDSLHTAPPRAQSPAVEPPTRTRARLALTWVLIGVFAALFVGIDPLMNRLAPAPGPPDPLAHPDLALELTGKVLLGARVVTQGLSGSDADREALQGQFRREIEKLAKPLEEIADLDDPDLRAAERATRLRTIMIGAEFVGADEAIEQLDELLDNPEASDALLEDGALVRQALTDGSDALDQDQRDRLIEHHGWVGRLTTTFDLPPTHDRRAALLSGAKAAFFALVGVGILAALGLLAGLAAFAVAIVLIGTRRIRPAYRPDRDAPPRVNAAYLQVMAIFLAGFCVLQLAGHALDLFRPNEVVQAAAAIAMLAAQWALLLAALWPLCRGETFARLRRGLGWHAGRGIFREVGSGILGYLAGLPVVALGLVATVALIMIFGFQPSHPIQEQARDSGIVNVILLFLLASVWAPLVEETMFRGAMYHAMRRWMAPVLSALIVAFLFAAIHPQGISTIPVLMSLAFVFAIIREWRGSLLGPMTAHALHNSILITLNVILLG